MYVYIYIYVYIHIYVYIDDQTRDEAPKIGRATICPKPLLELWCNPPSPQPQLLTPR